MKKYLSVFIIIFSVYFAGVSFVSAAEDSVIVNQNVSICVVDGVCGSEENGNSCPTDCDIQCDDHLDNDGDGLTDYPNDPGCDNATDDDETDPAPPPPPQDEKEAGGDSPTDGHNDNITLSGLSVNAGAVEAVITWSTDKAGTSKVFWGTTRDYAEGSLSNTSYEKYHKAVLGNLTPETVYYFRVEVDGRNTASGEKTGSFVTAAVSTPEIPSNVSNFRLSSNDSGILLIWENPDDPSFSKVRVVRKTSGYPQGPTDGNVIYEGDQEFIFDEEVNPGNRYYYGVFSVSDEGNYSSGVLGSEFFSGQDSAPEDTERGDYESGLPGEDVSKEEKDEPTGVEEGAEGGTEETSEETRDLLRLSDFLFVQSGETNFTSQEMVNLKAGLSFSVLVPEKELFGDEKQIVFERAGEQRKNTNYLLRQHEGEDIYRAFLPGYFKDGSYPFKIYIVLASGDFYTLEGRINIDGSDALLEKTPEQGYIGKLLDETSNNTLFLLLFAAALLLIIILFLIILKRGVA